MLILREIGTELNAAEFRGGPMNQVEYLCQTLSTRSKVLVSTQNLSRLTDFIFSNHIYTAPFCKLAPHKVGI